MTAVPHPSCKSGLFPTRCVSKSDFGGQNNACRGRDPSTFSGQTALHHAAKSAEVAKLQKLLRALKAVGADLKSLDTADERGFTPFHVACAGGHAEVTRLLCDAGCDTTLCNADGFTGWVRRHSPSLPCPFDETTTSS